MGRFFKTDKTQFLQNTTFELPEQLMANVVLQADKAIEDALNQGDASLAELYKKKDFIDVDKPAVASRIHQHQQMIKDAEESILNDVQNYQKYIPKIKSVAKEIEADLSTGLIGRASDQYAARKKAFDKIAAMKNRTEEQKKILKQLYDKKYKESGGLNFEAPLEYNQFIKEGEEPSLLEWQDTDKLINDLGKVLKPIVTEKGGEGLSKKYHGYITGGKHKTSIRNDKMIVEALEDSEGFNRWKDAQKELLENKAQLYGFDDKWIQKELAKEEEKVLKTAVSKLKINDKSDTYTIKADGRQTSMDLWAMNHQNEVTSDVEVQHRVSLNTDTAFGKTKLKNLSFTSQKLNPIMNTLPGFDKEFKKLVKKYPDVNGAMLMGKAISNYIKSNGNSAKIIFKKISDYNKNAPIENRINMAELGELINFGSLNGKITNIGYGEDISSKITKTKQVVNTLNNIDYTKTNGVMLINSPKGNTLTAVTGSLAKGNKIYSLFNNPKSVTKSVKIKVKEPKKNPLGIYQTKEGRPVRYNNKIVVGDDYTGNTENVIKISEVDDPKVLGKIGTETVTKNVPLKDFARGKLPITQKNVYQADDMQYIDTKTGKVKKVKYFTTVNAQAADGKWYNIEFGISDDKIKIK